MGNVLQILLTIRKKIIEDFWSVCIKYATSCKRAALRISSAICYTSMPDGSYGTKTLSIVA